MTSDGYGFPVTLGNHVSRHSGLWMWRIEVYAPDTMPGAWFTHVSLCAILDTGSLDLATISSLVQSRRDEIQECILGIRLERTAATKNTRNPERA
jgi:hypothetical protein